MFLFNLPLKSFVQKIVMFECLVLAKNFWPDDFEFIGIREMFDESIRFLKVYLPELCTKVEPQRVNPEKSTDTNYFILENVESALKDLLWARIAVYERARYLFNLRISNNNV